MAGRKKFIKGAIKHPGALSAKARRAGQSVYAYARAHEHEKGATGRQARFYLYVLRPAARRRKR